jgi:hypothetical protein
MDNTKLSLGQEILRLKRKIVNFITIEFFLFLLTLTFLNKLSHLFYTNTVIAYGFLSVSILLQLILILATRVAIYNWKCNKSILFSYETPDDEFFKSFKDYRN